MDIKDRIKKINYEIIFKFAVMSTLFFIIVSFLLVYSIIFDEKSRKNSENIKIVDSIQKSCELLSKEFESTISKLHLITVEVQSKSITKTSIEQSINNYKLLESNNINHILYISRVSNENKTAFEKKIQLETNSEFSIKSSYSRAYYFPLTYSFSNRSDLGITYGEDMYLNEGLSTYFEDKVVDKNGKTIITPNQSGKNVINYIVPVIASNEITGYIMVSFNSLNLFNDIFIRLDELNLSIKLFHANSTTPLIQYISDPSIDILKSELAQSRKIKIILGEVIYDLQIELYEVPYLLGLNSIRARNLALFNLSIIFVGILASCIYIYAVYYRSVKKISSIIELEVSTSESILKSQGIESLSSGVIIFDSSNQDYIIQYVNHSFESITGYLSEVAVGKDIRFFMSDQGAELNHKMKNSKASSTIEVDCIVKNGNTISCRLSISPIINQVKYMNMHVCLIDDITTQIKQTKLLEDTNNQLTKLNEVLIGREVRMTEMKSELAKYKSNEQ